MIQVRDFKLVEVGSCGWLCVCVCVVWRGRYKNRLWRFSSLPFFVCLSTTMSLSELAEKRCLRLPTALSDRLGPKRKVASDGWGSVKSIHVMGRPQSGHLLLFVGSLLSKKEQ